MLSSLLSLYIASTVDLHLGNSATSRISSPTSIVRTANFDFNNYVEQNSIPVKSPEFVSPIINAKAAISIDMQTGAILYEENAHERLPIASITKLMTILIILEENDLSDVTQVSRNASLTEGSTMWLREGEEITIKDLVLGALIQSANDAAVTLAEYNAGSVEAFVKKMNEKALKLGLVNTHFGNPIGLDTPNNYSSAYDIAKLSKYMYQKQIIRNAARLKELTVTSINGNYTHKLESTNDLLDSFMKFKGLKTGHTDAAGLCLVGIADNDQGNEIITVVLNSPARFTETKILADWIFRAYNW